MNKSKDDILRECREEIKKCTENYIGTPIDKATKERVKENIRNITRKHFFSQSGNKCKLVSSDDIDVKVRDTKAGYFTVETRMPMSLIVDDIEEEIHLEDILTTEELLELSFIW